MNLLKLLGEKFRQNITTVKGYNPRYLKVKLRFQPIYYITYESPEDKAKPENDKVIFVGLDEEMVKELYKEITSVPWKGDIIIVRMEES